MVKHLIDFPFCESCGGIANTAHHIIRQKNSNFLRDKQYNLISTCSKCHLAAHSRGDEAVFGLSLARRGEDEARLRVEGARIIIKDNIAYWEQRERENDKEINMGLAPRKY